MRSSDWSSDVCSSALRWRAVARVEAECARCHLRHDREAAVQLYVIESFDITADQFCAFAQHRFLRGAVRVGVALQIALRFLGGGAAPEVNDAIVWRAGGARERKAARKSVVQGKRVSVRVDLGGRRVITKHSTLVTCPSAYRSTHE